MKSKLTDIAGWIHATLILASLIPLIYTLGENRQDHLLVRLYAACLWIAFTVMTTGIAAAKCRSFLFWLLGNAAIVLASCYGIMLIQKWFLPDLTREYSLFLTLETIVVMVLRAWERLEDRKKQKQVKEHVASAKVVTAFLKRPSLAGLSYFVVLYIIGQNTASSVVCNIALASAFVYLFTFLIFFYLQGMENYIITNRNSCNILPDKIKKISNFVFMILILMLFVILLPVFFTCGNRAYHDWRQWKQEEVVNNEIELSENMFPDLEKTRGTTKSAAYNPKADRFVGYLFDAAAVVVVMGWIRYLYKRIRELLLLFQLEKEENGDKVGNVVLEQKDGRLSKKTEKKNQKKETEEERIRREYRTMIRKHRKGKIASYETPSEIEQIAGISEREDSKNMHIRYEKARYGSDGQS